MVSIDEIFNINFEKLLHAQNTENQFELKKILGNTNKKCRQTGKSTCVNVKAVKR